MKRKKLNWFLISKKYSALKKNKVLIYVKIKEIYNVAACVVAVNCSLGYFIAGKHENMALKFISMHNAKRD